MKKRQSKRSAVRPTRGEIAGDVFWALVGLALAVAAFAEGDWLGWIGGLGWIMIAGFQTGRAGTKTADRRRHRDMVRVFEDSGVSDPYSERARPLNRPGPF